MKKPNCLLSRSCSAVLTAAILLTATLTLPLDAEAAAGNSKLPPGLALGRRANGEDAITLLGSRLPDVAAAYGLRGDELAMLLRTQRSMWVDPEGALLYVCEVPGVSGTAVAPAGTATATTTPESITAVTPSTFTLHSTPGATRVIYLDFTGHVTSGTSWNSAFTGGASITSQPFDLDGNSSSFSEAECAFIYRVWQRVAEDFAAFNVDVTTEDPGVEALRNSGAGDTSYGQRVVISPTNWYNTGAGGVSYVGCFNWSSDTPNFAFTQQLANGEKYIAEAISHETGHALGLSHEGLGGSSPTEYYAGQGDWAPIMGNSYYRSVTQWAKGEYLNANNLQDQLAVMQVYGAPLIANLYGSTLATATPLNVPNFTAAGTIVSRTDVDMFRFNTGAGPISLNVANLSPEPNLNIGVQLLNSTGAVVQTGVPSVRNTSVSTNLAAGTYYVKINGVGSGDPLTTGYSNYGSVGNYVLTGSVVPTTANQAPLANAAASATSGVAPLPVNFSSAGSLDSDGSIVSYSWTFGDGTGSTAANPSHTYSNIGNYTATLVVTDNGGLSSAAAVSINVTAQANLAPTAVASGTPTNGLAPLPVVFSSAGSSDSDGTISSYRWDFGDGTSSTAASPSKTYNTAGNYTARLTVTDNNGGTSSATVAISAGTAPKLANPDNDIDVADFSLTTSKANSGTTASATVLILNRLGQPVAGVTVSLKWSGLVSGTSSGKTAANGTVVLTSARNKKSGTVTATITAVTPPTGVLVDTSIYNEGTVLSIYFN